MASSSAILDWCKNARSDSASCLSFSINLLVESKFVSLKFSMKATSQSFLLFSELRFTVGPLFSNKSCKAWQLFIETNSCIVKFTRHCWTRKVLVFLDYAAVDILKVVFLGFSVSIKVLTKDSHNRPLIISRYRSAIISD